MRDGVLMRAIPGDPESRVAWVQGRWKSYPWIDRDWIERLTVTPEQAAQMMAEDVTQPSPRERDGIADPHPMQLHLVSANPTEDEIRALFVALTGRDPSACEDPDADAGGSADPE